MSDPISLPGASSTRMLGGDRSARRCVFSFPAIEGTSRAQVSTITRPARTHVPQATLVWPPPSCVGLQMRLSAVLRCVAERR